MCPAMQQVRSPLHHIGSHESGVSNVFDMNTHMEGASRSQGMCWAKHMGDQ
jgi:hypothetical protein